MVSCPACPVESGDVFGKSDPSTRGWCLRASVTVVLVLALAIASTSPLPRLATTHIPRGTERSGTVPLLNLWTMWWNVDRIEQGYRDYWNAPIYHPVEGMLASVEPQTVVGLMAWPLRRLPLEWAAIYNVFVVLFLALNGWFACRLLQRMGLAWIVSLCGGAMMTVLPLVHWQIGVFQLISLWGILWTFGALVHFRRCPGAGRAAWLAVAFAVTYSLCCYYGLMLSLLLLIGSFPLLGRQLVQRRLWGWGGLSVAMALIILSPILMAQLRFAQEHWFAYPEAWIYKLSACPGDYLRTPWPQLIPLPDLGRNGAGYPWPLSPGTLKSTLALLGLAWGVWTRRRRRLTLWLGLCLVAAILLSMGPRLEIGDVSPYRWLANSYPGLACARSVFRFAFFVQLAVVLLAGIGLHGTYLRVRRWRAGAGRKWPAAVVVLVLGILMTAETWPGRPKMYRLPKAVAESAWIGYLRHDLPDDACLAFLPLPVDNTASALQPTAEWMYFQTRHELPMVNGYATFVPDAFRELRETLERFPNAEGIAALRTLGVTHLVVDRRVKAQVEPETMKKLGMDSVFQDRQAHMEIWRIPNPS
ncbi:MAG: hypothetical protein R6U98_24115 [Pirellulaceae bacterium]